MSDLLLNIVGVKEFSDKVLDSSLPVLVDFWAPWCGPCKTVLPELDFVATAVKGKAMVAKVNVDENTDLAVKYTVRSVPTFLIIKNGVEVKRLIGVNMRDELIKVVEEFCV